MKRTVLAALAFTVAVSGAAAFEVDETLKADREALKQVQTELKDLDYSPGVIDGVFGRNMQRAIETFHADQAADLAVGLTPAMIERIEAAHASWFAPPDYVRQNIFSEPESVLTVDITDLDPECNIPDCTVSMFLLAADDLTGDGAPDLVIATRQSDRQYRDSDTPSPVVILVNDGTGKFSHLTRDPRFGPRRVHGREAAVADFNGDNINDLFVAAHGLDRDPFPGEANLLMLSDGKGGLTDVSDRNLEPLSAMNHGVVAHNVDGDGDTDLFVISNDGANTIDPYFLINDGHGRFTRSDEEQRLTPSLRIFREGRTDRSKSTTARFADVNADGYSDFIFAISGDDGDQATRYSGMRRTRVVLNDHGNRWLKESAFELPVRRWGDWTYTTDVDAGDVDYDGDIDLLLTESTVDRKSGRWGGQHHQLFLNDGKGGFADATTSHLWNQGYPEMLSFTFPIASFLVDLDLDRDLDIVVQTADPAWKDDQPEVVRTLIALNDGTGHFSPVDPKSLSARAFQARQLRPADVDGDRDMDLVGLSLDGRMLDGEFYTGGFVVQLLRNRTKEQVAKD